MQPLFIPVCPILEELLFHILDIVRLLQKDHLVEVKVIILFSICKIAVFDLFSPLPHSETHFNVFVNIAETD